MSFQLFSVDIQLNEFLTPFILGLNVVNDTNIVKSSMELNLIQNVIFESFKVLKLTKQ